MGIGHRAWKRGHGAWEFSALPNASCYLPNSDIVIRIADSAPDMTEEVLKLLYSPGFATKRAGSSRSLGLSISYQIVLEKHSGQLKSLSSPEQGAEFAIEFPFTRRRRGRFWLGAHQGN